ncbi:helix-turn-helix transcriptional regulator [Paenibacillus aurantiacus]|uniref:Helix-turn-helix transcriptional regulator n=1 Tax=Paenibacillus aurantiacus TaxID=1936118 RepID=A0ABV5KXZ7_9BACL
MSKTKPSKPRPRFKEERQRKGTQLRVATDLGVTETFLRMLENGQAAPSVPLMFKASRYFNVDVYELWPDLAGERPEIKM